MCHDLIEQEPSRIAFHEQHILPSLCNLSEAYHGEPNHLIHGTMCLLFKHGNIVSCHSSSEPAFKEYELMDPEEAARFKRNNM